VLMPSAERPIINAVSAVKGSDRNQFKLRRGQPRLVVGFGCPWHHPASMANGEAHGQYGP